jgi:hypothetical protein
MKKIKKRKTVYVVLDSIPYQGYQLEEVFSTEKKAIEYIRKYSKATSSLDIYEKELL